MHFDSLPSLTLPSLPPHTPFQSSHSKVYAPKVALNKQHKTRSFYQIFSLSHFSFLPPFFNPFLRQIQQPKRKKKESPRLLYEGIYCSWVLGWEERRRFHVLITVVSCKKPLGLMRKMRELFCFYLLLILLLLSQASASSTDHGSTAAASPPPRFGSSRGGSAASELSAHAESGTINGDQQDGDAVFGNEKRRIYTGPNPLHNR